MIPFEMYKATPDFDGDEGLIAIVLRRQATDSVRGVQSLVSTVEPLQCLYVNYPAGHKIERHIHPQILRSSYQSQEVLVIRRGVVEAELVAPSGKRVATVILREGDVLIQLCGGHGFEMLEDAEIFEVKSGPYLGRFADKTKI